MASYIHTYISLLTDTRSCIPTELITFGDKKEMLPPATKLVEDSIGASATLRCYVRWLYHFDFHLFIEFH